MSAAVVCLYARVHKPAVHRPVWSYNQIKPIVAAVAKFAGKGKPAKKARAFWFVLPGKRCAMVAVLIRKPTDNTVACVKNLALPEKVVLRASANSLVLQEPPHVRVSALIPTIIPRIVALVARFVRTMNIVEPEHVWHVLVHPPKKNVRGFVLISKTTENIVEIVRSPVRMGNSAKLASVFSNAPVHRPFVMVSVWISLPTHGTAALAIKFVSKDKCVLWANANRFAKRV